MGFHVMPSFLRLKKVKKKLLYFQMSSAAVAISAKGKYSVIRKFTFKRMNI